MPATPTAGAHDGGYDVLMLVTLPRLVLGGATIPAPVKGRGMTDSQGRSSHRTLT